MNQAALPPLPQEALDFNPNKPDDEYQLIEETIAPVALDHMSSWILERFGG